MNQRVPTYVIVNTIILLVVTLIIYGQDLASVFSKTLVLSPQNISNYVPIIPLLIAFLLYKKRNMLLALASVKNTYSNEAIGLSLSLIAVLLFIYGSSTLYALEYHIYSLPLFISGMIITLFNLKMLRHLFFAVILLLFIIPPPGEWVAWMASDLSWMAGVIVNAMLSPFINITFDTVFGAPSLLLERPDGIKNTFVIGEPSSGVYSSLGSIIFALFVTYIMSGKVWKRLILLAGALPLFFLLNSFRIAIILLLWYGFGESVSEAFHAIGGVVMVTIGTIILLIVGERFLGTVLLKRVISTRCELCDTSEKMTESFCIMCGRMLNIINMRFSHRSITRAFLTVILAVLVVVNNPIVNASAGDLTKLDIESVKGPETIEYLLPTIDNYELRYAYRDTNVEKILRQDLSVAFTYRELNNNTEKRIIPTAMYVGIQIQTGKHRWEDSMIIHPSRVGRPMATVIELKDITIADDIEGRFFVYKRPKSQLTEVVLYWFERVPLRFGSNLENRNVQIILWNYAETLVRNGIVNSIDDIAGIERYYLSLAEPIAKYWHNIREHSMQVTVFNTIINQNIVILLGVTPFLAFYGIGSGIYNVQKIKTKNSRLMRWLQKDDILVINIVNDIKDLATGSVIAEKYRSIKGDISRQKFMEILLNARDTGLLQNDIVSKNDEPCMIWKANILTQ